MLFLACAWCAVVSYTELVPTRAVYRGTPTSAAPAAWQRLPFTAGRALHEAEGDTIVIAQSGELFLGPSFDPLIVSRSGSQFTMPSTAILLVHANGTVVGVATSTALLSMSCDAPKLRCTVGAAPEVEHAFGAVHAGAVTTSGVFIGSERGAFVVRDGVANQIANVDAPVRTLAASTSGGTLAAGTDSRLYLIDAELARVRRWEWVTNVTAGAGGVIDDAITALRWDDTDGALLVGTVSCVNRLAKDGTVSRIGASEGLPVRSVTAVASARGAPNSGGGDGSAAGARSEAQMWVGTAHGVALRSAANDPPWRFLNGPRWIVGDAVVAVAVVAAPGGSTSSTARGRAAGGAPSSSGDTLVVLTSDGGVTRLEQQVWTLAQKAAHMESMLLSRHNRHGLVGPCTLAEYGDLRSECVQGDNDNNGLWTSLVVAAEVYRYAATQDSSASTALDKYMKGLELLNEVTDVKGLMARSACAPAELAAQTCANGSWIHDKERWHASTAKGCVLYACR